MLTASIVLIQRNRGVYHDDLNSDGSEETLILKDGIFSLIIRGKVVWQSDSEWRVIGYYVGDLDRDTNIDLSLFLFKKGSFGRDKQLWVKENDDLCTIQMVMGKKNWLF